MIADGVGVDDKVSHSLLKRPWKEEAGELANLLRRAVSPLDFALGLRVMCTSADVVDVVDLQDVVQGLRDEGWTVV